jgi:hypothetical protein
MDKTEARAERTRLQKLLDGYEAGRVLRQKGDGRGGLEREVIPDRAAKVRARIARLDEVIAEIDDA